jgi:hypothetical protein
LSLRTEAFRFTLRIGNFISSTKSTLICLGASLALLWMAVSHPIAECADPEAQLGPLLSWTTTRESWRI